jgi:hypothetical protein
LGKLAAPGKKKSILAEPTPVPDTCLAEYCVIQVIIKAGLATVAESIWKRHYQIKTAFMNEL